MKNYVRRRAHWVVMSLILAVAACGGDPTGNGDDGGGGGGATSVTVGNDFFNSPDIIVDPGATVTWTWSGGSPEPGHNVCSRVRPDSVLHAKWGPVIRNSVVAPSTTVTWTWDGGEQPPTV